MAGRGHEHVGAIDAGLEQHGRLVGVADQHLDAELLFDGLRPRPRLLDHQHLVIGAGVVGDATAEGAGSCDHDPHDFHPIIFWNFSTADWWMTT